MKYNIIASSIIALVLISSLMFLNFKTGNVLIEYQESFNTGETLSGVFTITIEPGDSVNSESKIFFSLTKGDEVLQTKTLTFQEFVSLSGKSTIPTKNGAKEYFDTPESYSVEVSKIIPYTFSEEGEYDLFLNVFDLDLAVNKKITVN